MGKASSSGSSSAVAGRATSMGPVTTKIGSSTFTLLGRGAASYMQPSIGSGNPWEKADSNKPQAYEIAAPKRNPYQDRRGPLEVDYDKPAANAYRLSRFELSRPPVAAGMASAPGYGGMGMGSLGREYSMKDTASYNSAAKMISYNQAKKVGVN